MKNISIHSFPQIEKEDGDNSPAKIIWDEAYHQANLNGNRFAIASIKTKLDERDKLIKETLQSVIEECENGCWSNAVDLAKACLESLFGNYDKGSKK